MQYSVCLPAVFQNMEPDEMLRAVKEAGFPRYEIWSWWDLDLDALESAQKKEEIPITAMCTRMIPLNDPLHREAYIEGLKETAAVCHRFGCKTVISQVGQECTGVAREVQHKAIVDGLKACLPILKEQDLTLVIEPLNTRVDHEGYFLWSSEEAFQIIEEVGDAHVKVLYDLYHQYVMDDLKPDRIVQNMDKIGHFHLAGYPGRHEPMQDSEIDYKTILKMIRESGYTGCVGMEYFPVHDAKAGLCQLAEKLGL